MAQTPIISARDLTKRFGDLVAVDSVRFDVFSGECFGFLGPNGAGKTSTMKMISCVSPVTAGDLRVDGKDVGSEWRAIKSLLGVVSQADSLDPDLNVLQNLLVHARFFNLPRDVAGARAWAALDRFQLREKATQAPDELSGGMRRRLLIARALLHDPAVLVFDEPTTGLDPQTRLMVWDRLTELKSHGLTVLLTTHNMEEAAYLCDRLVVMDMGKILVHGSPDELIRRHAGGQVVEVRVRPLEKAQFVERLRGEGLDVEDRGWREGWIVPQPPGKRTGKKVAIVGSGPAGMAAAQHLNRAGHRVTVFERDSYVGGLLRLGIPDFKLEKHIVQRRVDQMAQEGVRFKTGVSVGKDIPIRELIEKFDAICLAVGSRVPRDLDVAGRDLDGIHFAMDYLTQQNRLGAGERSGPSQRITAEGKRVVVMGRGDTGSDCLGTAHHQGAKIVYQLELLPEPPLERHPDNPWPEWPAVLRTSSSHEEGGVRDYSILTRRFTGTNGRVERLHAVRLDWGSPDASRRRPMYEVPGSEFVIEADLVLLALGFLRPERNGMLAEMGVDLDAHGNVRTDENKMSSVAGVFAAGDVTRGRPGHRPLPHGQDQPAPGSECRLAGSG